MVSEQISSLNCSLFPKGIDPDQYPITGKDRVIAGIAPAVLIGGLASVLGLPAAVALAFAAGAGGISAVTTQPGLFFSDEELYQDFDPQIADQLTQLPEEYWRALKQQGYAVDDVYPEGNQALVDHFFPAQMQAPRFLSEHDLVSGAGDLQGFFTEQLLSENQLRAIHNMQQGLY